MSEKIIGFRGGAFVWDSSCDDPALHGYAIRCDNPFINTYVADELAKRHPSPLRYTRSEVTSDIVRSAERIVADAPRALACPICGEHLSSSIMHRSSHAVECDESEADLVSSWTHPSGGTSYRYFRFDKHVRGDRSRSLVATALENARKESVSFIK